MAPVHRCAHRAVLCRSYANLIVAYEYCGHPAEACAAALEGLALLPEYGLELAVGAALACNAANMLTRRGHYERCEAVLAELLDGRVVQGQGLHLHLERAELQLRMGNTDGRPGQPGGGGAAARRRRAAGRRRRRLRDRGAAARRRATTTAATGPSTRRCGGWPPRRTRASAPSCWSSGCAARPTGAARCPAAQDAGGRGAARAAGRRAGRRRPGRRTTTSTTPPTTAPPGTSWPARAATATAEDWAEAVRLWRAADRPREEAYCLLRQAECHAGREAAGQGGRGGVGGPGDRRAARRGPAGGRRRRAARPHPAVGGARPRGRRSRTGPTG